MATSLLRKEEFLPLPNPDFLRVLERCVSWYSAAMKLWTEFLSFSIILLQYPTTQKDWDVLWAKATKSLLLERKTSLVRCSIYVCTSLNCVGDRTSLVFAQR